MTERRSIDRGAFSFSELIEYGRYYVDKTSYLKELFMGVGSAKAPLFTRPRRFGKTLNMSMIQDFCELNTKILEIHRTRSVFFWITDETWP